MTSITFFLCFIPVLALLLLGLNLIFAPHSPYQEKSSTFECGFHSFLGQNRTQFSISFFIYALLFLLFDLELLVIYPFVRTFDNNEGYGLCIMLYFFVILTMGFVFELGKKALNIDSKQYTDSNSLKGVVLKTPVSMYITPKSFIDEINHDWAHPITCVYMNVLKYCIGFNLVKKVKDIVKMLSCAYSIMYILYLGNIIAWETIQIGVYLSI